jgi:hypothetical protein
MQRRLLLRTPQPAADVPLRRRRGGGGGGKSSGRSGGAAVVSAAVGTGERQRLLRG